MNVKTLIVAALCLPLAVGAQQVSKEKPKVYMVADAHLDTNWNWTVQTTINRYILNTMTQNLYLMDKYPDYVFNFEGAVKYAWMKEYYPELFEKVKKRIQEKRWHISGASWDASDAIMASPEAFTRNILFGQQFYKKEFGIQSTDIFLPDCFGFPITLPSIAAHCGLIGFSTQKLQWRHKPFYKNGRKQPFTFGIWEGIDGSQILMAPDAHGYADSWENEDLTNNADLKKFADESPLHVVYRYYGTGDSGGSPTINSVRSIEKSLNGNGPLQIISATSDQLFNAYEPIAKHPELPKFKGELLMDVHGTGCYTSQAAMKQYNRRNELLADATERASVVANWLTGMPYQQQTINEAWKRFIWHTFHDDITGTSLPEVYQNSWNDELISQKQFAQVYTSAITNIAASMNTNVKGIPVIIQNPIAQTVKDVIEMNVPFAKKPASVTVLNEKGKSVPAQLLSYQNGKAKIAVAVNVPSMSFAVYEVRNGGNTPRPSMTVTDHMLENSVYKIKLDANGDICSILDKRNNKELVEAGKAIRLALFSTNESYDWPSWEVTKKTLDQQPISITNNVKISVAEKGNLRVALCVERSYGNSSFKQYIRLTNGGQDDRIDIVNDFNWQTTNAFLKAEFPLSISNPNARYDLGLGSIERGNNTDIAYEVPAQQWADLSNTDGTYGVSVLNDCKYGWDKPNDHTLRLSLLHTPKTNGNWTYQSKQDFGLHHFIYSIVGHKGSYVDAQTVLKAEILNQSPSAFIVAKNKGKQGKLLSFMSVNTNSVSVKALKKAEESNDYIIRVYETTGKTTDAKINFLPTIQSADELNGVETKIADGNFAGHTLNVALKPFGVKTFRVRLGKQNAPYTPSAQCTPLTLPFNMKAVTLNYFSREANFDGKGNSYAAELWPQSIQTQDINFKLGDPLCKNALKCQGDTLQLPANGNINKIYLLAASTDGDSQGTFIVGNQTQNLTVPYFTGYIGQWGHTGFTTGYLKPQEIAYVATHIHNSETNKKVAYKFGYMFKFCLDIPKGATQLILPKNAHIVLFSATAAKVMNDNARPATTLISE